MGNANHQLMVTIILAIFDVLLTIITVTTIDANHQPRKPLLGYEKNEYWASCRRSCEPGEVDPNDDPDTGRGPSNGGGSDMVTMGGSS